MHPFRAASRLPAFTCAVALILICSGAATHASAQPLRAALPDRDAEPPVQSWTLPGDQVRLTPPRRGGSPLENGIVSSRFVQAGLLPEGDTPSDVQFTPDGARIVIAHRDTMNLIVFDAATRAFVAEVALSGSPVAVAISSDGAHAVTSNVFEDSASIVDLTSATELAVVPVGDQPAVVRISPDGATAVVGNTVDATLSVIDIASATELRRISGANFVASVTIAFEPGAITASFSAFEFVSNSVVLLTDFFNDRVRFFDIDLGTFTTLVTDSSPRGIAVTPDGATAVVAHTRSVQRVSVIDTGTQSITRTIATGVDLRGPIAITPGGDKAAAAVQNAVRVVNLNTGSVSGSLNTASVNQLLTTADGNYALGVGFRGSLISYASESIVRDLNNIVSTAVGGVSPTGPRAAIAANVFGEDMLILNTDGASGHVESTGMSGPEPELDKPRTMAVTPDGTKAVVAGNLSDTASIIDLTSDTVEAVVPIGNRPGEVAITPDGATAVVANLDSNFVSVIDLATHAVTNVTISRRGGEVEISPDGRFAYIAVVADGDGVWRVDLDTRTRAGPKLATGNMTSAGYLFNQITGMTLSHDGATLITCNNFDNSITLIDAANWSVITTFGLAGAPTRAIFSADDSLIYISKRDRDAVGVVSNAGGASAVLENITVGDAPFELALSPDQSTLYVANFNSKNIGVVDLASSTMTNTVSLGDNAPAGIRLSDDGATLFAATGFWSVSIGPGPVFSISTSGTFDVIDTANLTITDSVDLAAPAAMLAMPADQRTALIPSPFEDGLHVVSLTTPCAGDINQDGQVSLVDLGILLADFGATKCGGGPCAGDVDGDGDVDLADLALLLSEFGTTGCS